MGIGTTGKRYGWVLALAAALATAGCVEHEVIVKLRPDGSGEIIETTMARGEMAEMMRAMQGMEAAEGGEGAPPDGRAKAEARAAELGPGVALVSWEELEGDGFGERTVWSFEDIGAISVSQGPDGGDSGDDERVTFRFTRDGGESELIAVLAAPEEEVETVAAGEEAEPSGFSKGSSSGGMDGMAEGMQAGMLEMMRPMLEGFKTRVVVEVEGDVIDTNAPAVDGSVVTVLAFDFDQVLATEGAWEKLTALEDEQSLTVVGRALQGVPGVSVPEEPEVRIRFRGR